MNEVTGPILEGQYKPKKTKLHPKLFRKMSSFMIETMLLQEYKAQQMAVKSESLIKMLNRLSCTLKVLEMYWKLFQLV